MLYDECNNHNITIFISSTNSIISIHPIHNYKISFFVLLDLISYIRKRKHIYYAYQFQFYYSALYPERRHILSIMHNNYKDYFFICSSVYPDMKTYLSYLLPLMHNYKNSFYNLLSLYNISGKEYISYLLCITDIKLHFIICPSLYIR